jgi:hypothetical protein
MSSWRRLCARRAKAKRLGLEAVKSRWDGGFSLGGNLPFQAKAVFVSLVPRQEPLVRGSCSAR